MFDSGFGGLTVARAVMDLLPSEDLVYIGDTGRYPYGSKPLGDVRRYAGELARSLVVDFGAKAIIVACNTATAAGLDDLRVDGSSPRLRRHRARSEGHRSSDGVRPRRCDRHGRHRVVRCVRRCRRPNRSTGRARVGGMPGFRRVRRARSDHRRRGHGARRTPAGADPRCGHRRAAARLHPLPVPGAHDQRRDGPVGDARQLGRRDRLRRARPARRARPLALRPGAPANIASCRAATSTCSASSVDGCSAPNSPTPSAGRSPNQPDRRSPCHDLTAATSTNSAR